MVVQVEHARGLADQVVVDARHVEARPEQAAGHDGNFPLGEDEVAHYVGRVRGAGEPRPRRERECRRYGDVANAHPQVRAGERGAIGLAGCVAARAQGVRDRLPATARLLPEQDDRQQNPAEKNESCHGVTVMVPVMPRET